MAPAQGPAGFRPHARLHAQLSHAHRADPAAGALHPSGRRRLDEALGRAFEPAHARGVPRQLRNRVHRRSRQRRLRCPHRVGPGALPVSGQAFRRCAHRPAFRTADRGRRHRPDLAIRDDGLDRAAPVRPRSPHRLHAPRHLHRARLRRPALRRTDRRAGAAGARAGARGGSGAPGGEPLSRSFGASSCRRCSRRFSPGSPSPSRAPSASTGR